MKILKHGKERKPKNVIRFICPKCSCRFRADLQECDHGYHESFYYYMCRCPECKEMAIKLT